MFIGGIPLPVVRQFHALLDEVDCSLTYVCCSGSFRSERALHLHTPSALIHSNDVSFYSCVLGGWLADQPVPYRLVDKLAFLEELIGEGADPIRRAAGAVLGLEFSDWAKGKPNPYKTAHFEHLRLHAPELLDKTQAKLAAAFGDLKLAGFHPRDWVVHMDEGIERGALVVGFPPTYKSGYEAMYKWLDTQVEWERPGYELFDPASLDALVQRVHASGVPYVFFADRRLEGLEPRAIHSAPGKHDCLLYASAGEARVSRQGVGGKAFVYAPLDVEKIHAGSQVRVERTDGSKAMYIRQLFIKRSIAPVAGRSNFFVFIDDMLAGVLVYSPSKFFTREDSIYLLSDVSVTREGRVSKLISRLALNRDVLRALAAQLMQPVGFVETTAFSEHQVSMKYRGIFELLARRPATPPQEGWQLQYGGERLDESPQQAFEWWWKKHGDPTAKDARAAGAGGGRTGGRGGGRR